MRPTSSVVSRSSFALSWMIWLAFPAASAQFEEGASCPPSWVSTFGGQVGVDGEVFALSGHDDGGGAALFIGGKFTSAGGVPASHIAKWNGTSWSTVGGGIVGFGVNALAEFNGGGGSALYVGGNFTSAGGVAASNIARWNGTSWSALGGGANDWIFALAEFDDGGGPALYAGGLFTTAGGVAANRIAKWDGASWTALGSGMNGVVSALAEFDDGSGPALYAAGGFTTAGGIAASGIAKWNGTSWAALGSGTNNVVSALAVFDAGGGEALYAGGAFTTAGGVAASGIARWNGASWAALGSGTNSAVQALTVFDDGGVEALYAGGSFTAAGSVAASGIAKWNGASWFALGSGISLFQSGVRALTKFDDGGGPALYAGGDFGEAGGVELYDIASWDGTSWSALAGGNGVSGHVHALAEFDDGSGSALFAGGYFESAGGVAAANIAKWDGASWSSLGDVTSGGVRALTVFDDGTGPALYVGGEFTSADGVAAVNIAKWDGAAWSALGSGLSGSGGYVWALAVFDDGSGPALYAGGSFTTAGGVAASCIAKWDGASWSALGSGLSSGPSAAEAAFALTVFDSGSGAALYAGGNFTSAGGVSANNIAKWNGATWSALGSGVTGGPGQNVYALAEFDDGSGPALYVGGTFETAGIVSANNIAKWNGAAWSASGGTSGVDTALGDGVYALTKFNDGSGPALYVGGVFTNAGGLAASNIAMLDGTGWSTLRSGVNGPVLALTDFDGGDGPALYVGGYFTASPAGDSFLAKWSCPPPITTVPGCSGNPATLAALAASAPLGAPLPLRITSSAAVSGLGVVVYGATGIDGSGCGIFVPGFGELLLALAPAPKTLPAGVSRAASAISRRSCRASRR